MGTIIKKRRVSRGAITPSSHDSFAGRRGGVGRGTTASGTILCPVQSLFTR